MTNPERQQSLASARRACEWLREAYMDSLIEDYVNDSALSGDEQARRRQVMSLIAEFKRLDAKEQAQAEAGREHGHKGGRPKKAAKKRRKK